jgi:hypothetical protein
MAASDLTGRDQAERAVNGAEISIPLDQLHLVPALLQVISRAANLGRETLALMIAWAHVAVRNSAITPHSRDWRFADPTCNHPRCIAGELSRIWPGPKRWIGWSVTPTATGAQPSGPASRPTC